jgi:small subunit ribosomal protein S21
MRRKKFYEKPSVRKAREKNEALRRLRKLARKQAQRDGLSPSSPRRKPQTSGGLATGRSKVRPKDERGVCSGFAL